jgi:hypothetical protein
MSLLMNGQSAALNIKSLQKHLVKTEENLYFSSIEVTNEQYTIFLNDLKLNKQRTKYESVKIDSSQWRAISTYNEPFVQYYHAHPAYAEYPVVNISHQGAKLYCEWLTEQYNANPKRKFNKVKFRLPTEEEWITAAKGGNPGAIYPWKGNDLKTAKGLYRCNFIRASDDTIGVAGKDNDNAEITAPAQSYWPNALGLYNMSGNVAEMVVQKGRTMGGSWLDSAEAMKIGGIGKYSYSDAPKATIGFRYVMEVIETQPTSNNSTLNLSAFNSDTCCWRKLSQEKHFMEAGELIVRYIKENPKENHHALHWHAGQMYACANANALAKKHFKKTYSPLYRIFGGTDAKTWYYYAKGTVAFIDNEPQKLQRILEHWETHFEKDLNHQMLVRLNQHWGESYANIAMP